MTLVEAGPDPGTPPPSWTLDDYLLPDECYDQYTDADNGMALPQGRGTGGVSTVTGRRPARPAVVLHRRLGRARLVLG